jgi:hypothetical protein
MTGRARLFRPSPLSFGGTVEVSAWRAGSSDPALTASEGLPRFPALVGRVGAHIGVAGRPVPLGLAAVAGGPAPGGLPHKIGVDGGATSW